MIRSILRVSLITLSFFIVGMANAELTENKDYVVLKNPPTYENIPQGKVEVIEFFSYGCSYCYKLEPELLAWLTEQSPNVTFKRIAIPRKGKWFAYARLYYALGLIPSKEQARITPLIYNAIHEQKLNLEDDNELLDWAASENVDREQLAKYYQSVDVDKSIAQAFELAKSYELQYVPTIIVNNKYQLQLDSSNNYAGTKEKLAELVKLAETN